MTITLHSHTASLDIRQVQLHCAGRVFLTSFATLGFFVSQTKLSDRAHVYARSVKFYLSSATLPTTDTFAVQISAPSRLPLPRCSADVTSTPDCSESYRLLVKSSRAPERWPSNVI
ncbi:hypothetical protein RRG08_050693 [Elysia crispata]|uniref:Uncharacterized protein n=1 Tax=Elysia crispata TaxID=231223 RepID=A0AAE1A3P8_9GAST|nr:hypothetical protein RRG08_050693 [Elysia crispata]